MINNKQVKSSGNKWNAKLEGITKNYKGAALNEQLGNLLGQLPKEDSLSGSIRNVINNVYGVNVVRPTQKKKSSRKAPKAVKTITTGANTFKFRGDKGIPEEHQY